MKKPRRKLKFGKDWHGWGWKADHSDMIAPILPLESKPTHETFGKWVMVKITELRPPVKRRRVKGRR